MKRKSGSDGNRVAAAQTIRGPSAEGILIINSACRIQRASTRVRRWLKRYFESDGQFNSVPTRLRTWLETPVAVILPLVITQRDQRLTVRLLCRPDSDNWSCLLLTERYAPAGQRGVINLTAREEEVMWLIGAGMVDKEIAAELGIALPTVRKHLDDVYPKLHVHNRTAAMVTFRRQQAIHPAVTWL